MGILANLEPQKVFYYFEEITKIPHGSGNVKQISDYLKDFAEKRGLVVIQDKLNNIIIFKEATPGYEQEPAVILQGHMDMVAVKTTDCDIDMRTEGLRLAVDGDHIYAEGTSLGGDDGIAVAYALALLDSGDLQHPRLEIVITTDEEVGMDGARGIDLSMLRGSRLLNLDSEDEGIFLTSCAGGARVNCQLPLETQEVRGYLCELVIGGLLGGHSGGEIHKERGNSNCLFGRVLWKLTQELPIRLVSVAGGLADNAIPRETRATLLLPVKPPIQESTDIETEISYDNENTNERKNAIKFLEQLLEKAKNEIAEELAVKDPGFAMQWDISEEICPSTAATLSDTRRAAAFLAACPNGVQSMSADIEGLVETSLNLGILKCEGSPLLLNAEFSVRSSLESAKWTLIEKLTALTELSGGNSEVAGDYPGWKYRADSPLREKMIRVYQAMYGCSPKVEAIHAGLECGLLGSKIADLDCVSIGPDMRDIHTTEETLSISSTKRVWEFLVRLLATKD